MPGADGFGPTGVIAGSYDPARALVFRNLSSVLCQLVRSEVVSSKRQVARNFGGPDFHRAARINGRADAARKCLSALSRSVTSGENPHPRFVRLIQGRPPTGWRPPPKTRLSYENASVGPVLSDLIAAWPTLALGACDMSLGGGSTLSRLMSQTTEAEHAQRRRAPRTASVDRTWQPERIAVLESANRTRGGLALWEPCTTTRRKP
jgi:hypothetical protein